MGRTSPMGAREVGAALVDGLASRGFSAVRSLLADQVRFRMLLPSGPATESDADASIERFIGWFADADVFEVDSTSVGEVEGRATVTYRFRLHEPEGWRVIEQHLMLDVGADGRVEAIDLLCSGFRSITADAPATVHRFDAGSLGCADGLAGEFRRRVQQIPVGDVLVVSTRDPAAKEDLPPLARMMGHVVRSIEASDDGRLLVNVERGR
jgi:TusA-related sulfurtransferase